jgi:hypothetical protein
LRADPAEKYWNLHQVLGGYLNQDFLLDFSTPDAALRAAAEGQGRDQVAAAIREIDELIASPLTDDELDHILDRLTANGYSPRLEGWEIRPWLEHARGIMRAGE